MRSGKTRFRRQPIVDRDDSATPEMTKRGAQRIARVEIAGDQAAAVKEDQARQFGFVEALGRVDAQRYCEFPVRQRVGEALDLLRGSRQFRERRCGAAKLRQLRRARSVSGGRVDEI